MWGFWKRTNSFQRYQISLDFQFPRPVKDQLHKLQIDTDAIQYFGSLATNRAEKETEKGLIVLDHSRYLNKEDYEIEFEAADWHEGRKAFEKLLQQFSIPQRETKNKILRFYEEKRKSI